VVLESVAERPQIDRLQIEHVISFIPLEQAVRMLAPFGLGGRGQTPRV